MTTNKQQRLLDLFQLISTTENRRADLKQMAAVDLKYNNFRPVAAYIQELIALTELLNDYKFEHAQILKETGANHDQPR